MDNEYIIDRLRKLSEVMKPKEVPERYRPVASFYKDHFYFGWDYSESIPLVTPYLMNKITRQLAIYLITGNKVAVTIVSKPIEKPIEKPKEEIPQKSSVKKMKPLKRVRKSTVKGFWE